MRLWVCIRKILWGTFNQLPREHIENSRDLPREQIHHTTPSSFQQIVPNCTRGSWSAQVCGVCAQTTRVPPAGGWRSADDLLLGLWLLVLVNKHTGLAGVPYKYTAGNLKEKRKKLQNMTSCSYFFWRLDRVG